MRRSWLIIINKHAFQTNLLIRLHQALLRPRRFLLFFCQRTIWHMPVVLNGPWTKCIEGLISLKDTWWTSLQKTKTRWAWYGHTYSRPKTLPKTRWKLKRRKNEKVNCISASYNTVGKNYHRKEYLKIKIDKLHYGKTFWHWKEIGSNWEKGLTIQPWIPAEIS